MTYEELIAKLSGVDGYFSDDEAWALYQTALRCARSTENPRIVEIGSYKGRSTIASASALAETGRGTVVAIDPHAPTGKASYTLEHGTLDTYDDFLANISWRSLNAYVISIRTTSAEARHVYDGQPIDLLFIDGSHDYEDVLADIDMWTPLLAGEAIVAFNDPYAAGVNRALRERLLSDTLSVESPRHVNNTLFAISRRSARTSSATKRLLSLYLWIERMRFKMLKLALKGLFETARLVYVPASAVRSDDWRLFSEKA